MQIFITIYSNKILLLIIRLNSENKQLQRSILMNFVSILKWADLSNFYSVEIEIRARTGKKLSESGTR